MFTRPTSLLRRLPLAALCVAVALGLATPSGFADARAETPLADIDRATIETIVREYLMEHPEIIGEALTALQQREELAEQERQRQAVVALNDQIYDPSAPFMGNPDGDVTLVEFFDYQCGYCKRVLDTVFEATESDPGLRVVFKEFPILGPVSVVAAQASLASRNQGLYTEFHHALMAYRGQLSEEAIYTVAAEIGLDVGQLREDMKAPEIRDEIAENRRLAGQIGIRGTPAFVIGDTVAPGAQSLQALQSLIEKARAS